MNAIDKYCCLILQLRVRRSPDVTLRVWDVPGDDAYTLIHHSLFTPNALYILVWDFYSIARDITHIRAWISNIQVHTLVTSLISCCN